MSSHLCRKASQMEEILAIDIKPGWKKGTKITFPDKGNQKPGTLPADLVFVIDEKPHDVFKRDGNDLVCLKRIPLVDALADCSFTVTTLDGRQLPVVVSEVIYPGLEIVIPKEGFPGKEPGKKGNLRIRFDVKFPSKLTSEQKAGIRELLKPRLEQPPAI